MSCVRQKLAVAQLISYILALPESRHVHRCLHGCLNCVENYLQNVDLSLIWT